ncbi:MAG TPA: SusC/RagA family TonB-linked outer membrane protein, partial [Bacteroidales bacterium]|nr:SusC/RagA family TonB-linked outer membrane protein [Bacteroidales bacterium]
LNTLKGVATDADGRFVLTLAAGENTIQVTYVGMKTQDINVQGLSNVEVVLQYDVLGMEEIVVVGYGVQRKGDVTSSISSVKADAFVKGAVKDAAQLIQGKVAGLTISNPSGDPTSNAQIMLRGITTLSASTEPLILIDGIPGSLSTVAPEDIESIDVLKDGSAAAIYGTRGTNGVIIITTKGVGQDVKPVIEYNAYATIQTIARQMPFLNADQYREHMADVPGFVDLGSSTDWLGEITRVPVSMNHNLTMKGGNTNTNYTASVNYRYWEGLFIRSDNRQASGRFGVNHTAFDGMLKMNFNSIIRDRTYWTGGDGYSFNSYVYRQAIIRNPTDAIYDENGIWQERNTYFYDNPVAYIMESDGQNNDREIQMNGKVTLTPVKRWNINLLISNTTYNQTRGFAQTKKHVSTTKSGRNGYASRGTSANQRMLLELTTDYAHTFGKSNINLMGGYSYQNNVFEGFYMTNWDFPTDFYSYNRMQSGDALTRGEAAMNSSKSENTLIAFFARGSYNFDDKYLLMASLRQEGSSKFGANHKWGTFPAISAGWRISRESFMEDIDFISDLKLRAGYGITGTAPGNSYMSLISLNYGARFLSNGVWIQGVEPNRNPNPDLRWEKKEEINIGLDFGFLDGRLNGTVDFYRRRTKDMLWDYQVPTPPYLYSSITSNVGVMDNHGLEVLIQGTPVAKADFNWMTGVTYSTNRNKLVSLSNEQFQTTNDFFYTGHTGEPIQQTTHIVKIGDQIGNFYGWKSVDISDAGIWI